MRCQASENLKNLLSFIVLRFQKLAGNSVDLDETAYNDLPHLDLRCSQIQLFLPLALMGELDS